MQQLLGGSAAAGSLTLWGNLFTNQYCAQTWVQQPGVGVAGLPPVSRP